MRKLNQETINSRKTYYFGVMALLLFLVQVVLKWTQRTSETKLPQFFIFLTVFLALVLSLVCIWHGVLSLREPNNAKKLAGIVLAMLSFGFVAMLVFNGFMN